MEDPWPLRKWHRSTSTLRVPSFTAQLSSPVSTVQPDTTTPEEF